MTVKSEPTLSGFDPKAIPWQYECLNDIRNKFDYSKGAHDVMMSGSYGSAKSTLMAHIVVTHCLKYPGARACLGRLAMPDLKATIYNEIVEHIIDDLKEGYHFKLRESQAHVSFANGSEIISRSWSDKKYGKARSLRLSLMCFEELVESDTDEAFMAFKARVGRQLGIPEYLTICATNPDSPAHWAYKYFIESDLPTRHVYYSETIQNPFLPKWYLDQLYQDLDEKAFQRYGKGIWVEINADRIYYAYDTNRNYRKREYEVDLDYPIHLCWDFNIGEGKPLSMCLCQFINGQFHFFGEVIIEGASTEEACDELASKGFLDYDTDYIIEGDATGAARSTKSKQSDYDIIKKYLANYVGRHGRLRFEKKVPKSNPPIRKRHNIANAYCKNKAGQVRMFVYKGAPTLHEGMRLTALKKGGSYIEDDSKEYQHVTTAATYCIHRVDRAIKSSSGVRHERTR